MRLITHLPCSCGFMRRITHLPCSFGFIVVCWLPLGAQLSVQHYTLTLCAGYHSAHSWVYSTIHSRCVLVTTRCTAECTALYTHVVCWLPLGAQLSVQHYTLALCASYHWSILIGKLANFRMWEKLSKKICMTKIFYLLWDLLVTQMDGY